MPKVSRETVINFIIFLHYILTTAYFTKNFIPWIVHYPWLNSIDLLQAIFLPWVSLKPPKNLIAQASGAQYRPFNSNPNFCNNGQVPLLVSHQRAVHIRKISQIVLNTNEYLIFNCNVLALFTFYALPSSGKDKCMQCPIL